MVSMEPFVYHETKNIDEHNQIVSKINELVEDRNAADGQIDAVKQTADTALADAGTARQTADDAKALATTADGKATTNATDIATNTADIGTLNGLMEYMNANAFITVVFNKTATAITAMFTRKDGSTYSANLPIATTTSAGFMDSAMKQQLDANTNAIVVLQSQYPTIFVTFPNASPTQTEIQTVYDNYRTAYPAINLPAIPAQGFTMIDTTNNITVAYDKVAVQWVFSTNAISKATNSTYGVLVGEENGADGSLYIVAGKALVNGFDALKGRMDDAETAIALKATRMSFEKPSTGEMILYIRRADETINSRVVINSISDESVGANVGCLITKEEYAKAKAGSIATTKPAYVVGVDALDGAAKLYKFVSDRTITIPPYISSFFADILSSNVMDEFVIPFLTDTSGNQLSDCRGIITDKKSTYSVASCHGILTMSTPSYPISAITINDNKINISYLDNTTLHNLEIIYTNITHSARLKVIHY